MIDLGTGPWTPAALAAAARHSGVALLLRDVEKADEKRDKKLKASTVARDTALLSAAAARGLGDVIEVRGGAARCVSWALIVPLRSCVRSQQRVKSDGVLSRKVAAALIDKYRAPR